MPLTPGAALGVYRLVERLAEDELGELWRGVQSSLERDVTIRALRPHFAAQPGFLERFRHEALAVSRLKHPAIPPLLDFGDQAGTAYLVTRFLPGEPLAARLGRAWPPRDAARLLEPPAAALDHAHALGVVHGDVEPGVIRLIGPGQVQLEGFGLMAARAALEEAQPGRAGLDLAYRSPERLADGSPFGTPTDDLYALAVVAYQLLTGQLPFDGRSLSDLARAIRFEPPLPPRIANPSLPPAFDSVLARGLAKDAADRFPSGAALLAALADADRPAGPPAAVGSADATMLLPGLGRAAAERGSAGAAAAETIWTEATRPVAAVPPARPPVPPRPPPEPVEAWEPTVEPTRPQPSVAHRARPSRPAAGGLLALVAVLVALLGAGLLGSRLLSSGAQATPTPRPTAAAAAPAAAPAAATAAPTRAPTTTGAPPTSLPVPTLPPPVAITAEPKPKPTEPSAPKPTSAPAPPKPSEAPAPKPGAGGSEALLQAHRATVADKGFTPEQQAVAPWRPGQDLIAIKGICTGSVNGRCQQVFFFLGERYLGTDTLKTSPGLWDLATAGPGRVRVTYASYAPNDPGCCPSRPPVTITYSWDGQRLTPDGTPPGH